MDTIHLQCPVTPMKSVKLQQDWIWVLLSLLISNTTCPDILWGSVCLRLFTLAMLKIWKGRKKKKRAAVGRNHKNTLCNVLPPFSLSCNNRAALWGSGRCMKNSWARSPFWVSCPLDLGCWFLSCSCWQDEFWSLMKAVVLRLKVSHCCCFWRNESVKGPFCFFSLFPARCPCVWSMH